MNVQVSQQKIRSLKRFVQNKFNSKQHYSSVSPNVNTWRIAYMTSSYTYHICRSVFIRSDLRLGDGEMHFLPLDYTSLTKLNAVKSEKVHGRLSVLVCCHVGTKLNEGELRLDSL